MLCVAAYLGVTPLPLPKIEEIAVHGYWGRYLWQTETVQVWPGEAENRFLLGQEIAHYLQHKHGLVRFSRAGIPVFGGRDTEDPARAAGVVCG